MWAWTCGNSQSVHEKEEEKVEEDAWKEEERVAAEGETVAEKEVLADFVVPSAIEP